MHGHWDMDKWGNPMNGEIQRKTNEPVFYYQIMRFITRTESVENGI